VPKSVTSGRGSAIAFFVLVVAGAIALRLNRVPTPVLRRLGPLASASHGAAAVSPPAPEPGGLGRFSRRRTGAPPPLV
jgi:hypothetical protein